MRNFTESISFVLIFLFINYSYSQNAGDNLFDNSFLHQIQITSSTAYADLPFNQTYVQANINIDGDLVLNVGLRLKGNTSASIDPKPLKIDLNEYVDDQTFDGLKKFNLHNNYMDPSLMHESLAYTADRRAGIAAPRVAYAQVMYNDEFLGVYSLVEQVDKTFLKENFADNDGDLYKGLDYIDDSGIDVEVKEGTMTNYLLFKDQATGDNLGDYLHLRNYYRYMATQMLIGDWDSYPYGRHNYYMYFEPTAQRFNFIPWDHNFAFEDETYEILYPLEDVEFIANHDANKVVYQQTMCELIGYLLDTDFYYDLIDHNYDIIMTNTGGVTIDENFIIMLKNYIVDRRNEFIDQLALEGVTCDEFSYPYAIGDLVINEFVASNDGADGGVLDPEGDDDDWIELYNNSSQDITLNHHFYLSNDKDFLKKWYFKEDIVIPANGYVIVWADKDVNHSGPHSNFKIGASGGELFLAYEDLTILDSVQYEEQTTNLGYARVPNGTGNFIIQVFTYNANNETLSLSENTLDNVKIFPNPNTGKLWINLGKPIQQVNIYDTVGKLALEVNSPAFPLNIEQLKTGLYFIQIKDNDGNIISKKLLKE
ncbi:MAG: CotH kinase family protein [Xanthomarina gelatinilytica]|uniref:CotH kinase family protein n=1 Tax=Xanthomarina gelatinilytica TaxID=1137281 RepID=UPI003A836F1F